MKKIDILFIHPVTHVQTPKSTLSESVTNLIMPLGTIAIADLLDKEGYETRIIHTGIEQIYNRNFRIENLFKKYDVTTVGVDLHWYIHSYDAIRVANIVKDQSNAFVVLGGFTASFFAEEILSRFNSVDAVIRGDAEIPLIELLKKRASTKIEEVPNLMYRHGKSLKQSKRSYVADTSDLDKLSFTNFPLFENFEKYSKVIKGGDLSPFGPNVNLKRQGWTCLGRGCSVDCSYCGGGKNAFKILTGRLTPIFRSKEKVIETLAKFEEAKISSTYMDFDPDPTRRKYYHELFALIRREKIDMGAEFLLWAPSNRFFLSDFKRTFNPLYSTLTLSPESGSEHIRKLNKGFYYDNEELFSWLQNAKKEMMPIELFYTSGLSGETVKHFEETIKVGKKIVDDYPMVLTQACNPIQLDPGCPRFLSPKKHGVSLKFREFMDFYDLFRRFAEGIPISSYLGYETKNLTESQIIELSLRFNETISTRTNERWENLTYTL